MRRDPTLLWLGAGGVLAYLLYRKASAAVSAVTGAAGAAYGGAVNTVSDTLSNFFGPSPTAATATFYIVIFPDGTRNAVPANTVDAQGNFNWTGYPPGSLPAQSYQIFVGSDGTKYALSN